MKRISVYEAEDGKRFDKKDECVEYEKFLKVLYNDVIKYFNTEKHSDSYAVQHEKEEIDKAYDNFMELCSTLFPRFSNVFKETELWRCGDSLVYRILSDSSHDFPSLWDVFFRFNCISTKNYVEYPQPYYAKYPEDWKQEIDGFEKY